ncbi:chromosome partitioning protein [Actinoplanes lobatus]|uniref:Chromosome partitioning protein n=1 Tax=Actinoplanes lobatus TaxID=113568 RepID=A0A7W7MF68_9ACTN|nr:ParA family protein [Actinoplanes lobatus]MBB4748022.1 MinD-like ATPase involved in chromosome partitioning or flagellar assembly [Actinoplanes lobatus]GGN80755.1 chromosome partitioning protein [Actinoplanes lobatus]GIE41511.1 chromosome partitioning protein [Actinoplanes lobatus]
MADENADRVHAPGAESAPPARDVEPFWADEPETPVHGRAVPLTDRMPPVGMTQVEPGVYRPSGDTSLPPGVHLPSQRPPAESAPWPGPEPVVPAVTDSPWAQPPQRPAESAPMPPATQPVPVQPVSPLSAQPAWPGPAEPVPTQPAWPGPAEPVSVQPAPVEPVSVQPVVPAVGASVVPPPFEQPAPPQAAVGTPSPTEAAPWPPEQAAVTTPNPAEAAPWPPQAVGEAPVHTTPLSPPQQQGPPPGAAEIDPFQDLLDATPTAEEFARRRLARPSQQSATMGARAMLRKSTFGLLNMAPGQQELEYKQDVEMVRRNFGGLRQVTVVNPKGGAGKTVAVLLLAMTFGQKRGGYVLAWDNNETQGTLGMRAQQDFHARTVRDMMRDLHLFQGAQGRVGDLSQYVRAQGEGMFDVLASDESATAGEMLTADSFAEIRDVVSRFYKLIFVDTGNNVRAENWQAAMDATDQLVITMSARNDSAETAARALDHLEQSGRRRLVRQAVTIVTMPPTRKDIDLPWIQQHFAARTRAVLLAPYERLIDSGEPIRYGELSSSTKDAWLKIAAAVAEGL